MSKSLLSLIILLSVSSQLKAQALRFFEKSYDFGEILENQQFTHKFYFRNASDSVLVLTSARTGDGGTMANYPKEPIMPGDTAYVTFYVNTKGRYGRWSKQLSVYSNQGHVFIQVKGEVIRPSTSVKVLDATVKLNSIDFGNLDTARFQIINTGIEPLHIGVNRYTYQNEDIYSLSMREMQSEYPDGYSSTYQPGDTLMIQVVLRNCFGNTGDYKRTIQLHYNNHDTLELSIEGKYVAQNVPDKIYEHGYIFYYENKQLYLLKKLNTNGTCQSQKYFQNGECVQMDSFDWRTHQLRNRQKYKNGQLISEEHIK